jgi:hypothetical protein
VKAGWLNVTLTNNRNTDALDGVLGAVGNTLLCPRCVPGSFNDSELLCSVFELFGATVEGSLFRAERKRIYNDLERTDDTVSR